MILKRIAQKKNLFAQSTVGKETILVPLRDSVANMNEMVTLNEPGSFIWDKITISSTIESLTKEVVDNFEVDEQTAKTDINSFVQKLYQFTETV